MTLELPASAFPDGDASAIAEEADDGGQLARLLRGVVFVVLGLIAFGWLLGQLRSTTAGYLFVPAVLAGFVYLGRLAGPLFARQRAHAMEAWQRRTGMRWIDPAPVTEHPARILKPLGITPSLHGLVLEGRPWSSAPPTTRMADASYGSGRDLQEVTLLAIPLPDRGVDGIDEVALTFGTRLGDVLDPLERWLRRWPIVTFERSDRLSRVRVRTPEGRDPLPIWDVFDPALLVRLEDAAARADAVDVGMVVRDGWLVAWCDGNLVERGANEFVAPRLATADGSATASLPTFFELTRLVQERLAR